MSDGTSIEWTDATWNPVRGCSRISPGCENCYAERFAHRFHSVGGHAFQGLTVLGKSGPRWNGEVRFIPEQLAKPLSWKKPRRVFVNSMADTFHDAVQYSELAAMHGVMAACSRHTFQVLTKRPGNVPGFLDHMLRTTDAWGSLMPEAAMAQLTKKKWSWPLSNVWLGTSVENQECAEKRIPELLKCPAAVRWLSVEPLLGHVDLSKWLERRAPCREAPATWDEYPWPEWVPEKTRAVVRKFWSCFGRGPADYHDDIRQQTAPPFGKSFRYDSSDKSVSGRYVHCWNNIGRLIDDCGEPHFCSFGSGTSLFDWKAPNYQPINWVVIGGESGPGARPCKAEWIEQVVDDCRAANVPVFFKQWGKLANNPDKADPTAKKNGGNVKGGCTLRGEVIQEYPR